jgi:hypothetical protein
VDDTPVRLSLVLETLAVSDVDTELDLVPCPAVVVLLPDIVGSLVPSFPRPSPFPFPSVILVTVVITAAANVVVVVTEPDVDVVTTTLSSPERAPPHVVTLEMCHHEILAREHSLRARIKRQASRQMTKDGTAD